MKSKLQFLLASVIIVMASCSGNTNAAEDSQSSISAADSLAYKAISERDSLIAMFNEISEDMIKLRQLESIIILPGNMHSENASVPTIQDDIRAIQQSLKERRERLAELEKKIVSQAGKNKQLQTMIENLKAQITQNESEISKLQQQLSQANAEIANLNVTVDSLNTSVANVTAEKNSVIAKNESLTEDLYRCYYAIGSSKELKEHKIIETGFLKKTKVLQSEYELTYFTASDKRTLKTIPLYSKKVKIHTGQPKDSYTITEEANGSKTLNITNSNRFWGTSNFLVIQID